VHWYKRDPDAALAGMAELTFEERGAYNSILDLLYSRDGDVPDDDVRVSRMIACHWRTWAALKSRLIELGKLRIEGGKIVARRVQETIKEAAELSEKQRKKAAQRWEKEKSPNENNATNDAAGNASTSTTTSTATAKEEKKERSLRSRGAALPDDWKPTDDDQAYGISRGLSLEQVSEAAEDMRLWAKANSNRSIGRKADWSSTFKSWMRRNRGKTYGPSAPNGLSAALRGLKHHIGEIDGGEEGGGPPPRLLSHG
jgi:uncharacterized protein YdaU (DUF1376 family)